MLGAATYRVSPTVVVDAVAARLQHHLRCGGHCGFVSHEDDWHRFWRKAVSGDQTKPGQSSVLLAVSKHGGNGLKRKKTNPLLNLTKALRFSDSLLRIDTVPPLSLFFFVPAIFSFLSYELYGIQGNVTYNKYVISR